MRIAELKLKNFRNLRSLGFTASATFNLIYGPNGCGKTSILEALAYLSLGRSFRAVRYPHLITRGADNFFIEARIQPDEGPLPVNLAVGRERTGGSSIRINGAPVARLVDLATHLCVQIIHPEGSELVNGAAELRRGFLDWGVFYSSEQRRPDWSRYRRVLSQRNALLQHPQGAAQLAFWDDELCALAERITTARGEYLQRLRPFLEAQLELLLPEVKLEFSLSKGWDEGRELKAVLKANLEVDRAKGYTYYGCHRADLKIKNLSWKADETLSRGQLKLLVCALRLAQSELLLKERGISCVFLIDDLNAELDSRSRTVLFEQLRSGAHQVFITNIDPDLPQFLGAEVNLIEVTAAAQSAAGAPNEAVNV